MHYLLFFFLLLGSFKAQSANEPVNKSYDQLRKQGDKLYASKKYFEALPFYKKYHTRYQDDILNWVISDCFWNMGQYDSSLVYLEKLEKKSIQVLERNAEICARNGNYQRAIQIYQELMSTSSAKKDFYNTRKNGFEKRDLFLRDSLDWNIEYLSINTSAREFAPFVQRGKLYFVSNRNVGFIVPKTNASDGQPYDDVFIGGELMYLQVTQPVYSVNKTETNSRNGFLLDLTPSTSNDNNTLLPSKAGITTGPSASVLSRLLTNAAFKGHVGPVSMSEDGQYVFFTRTSENKKNGVYLLELCKTTKTSAGWSKPQVLSVNTKESSSFHPFYVDSEKVLLFCSDRPGGIGGSDIYRSYIQEDGSFTEPVNLGARINSTGDEWFPLMHNGKLYFSSNGWSGLGGVDIYEGFLKQSNHQPINLGYPINTSSDDYSISFADDASGFIASNRYGSDDIFRFSYAHKTVTIKSAVTSTNSGLRQEGVLVTLEQQEENGSWKTISSQTTDHKGVYSFEVRPNQANYRIRLSGKDFQEQIQLFDSKGVTDWKELNPVSISLLATKTTTNQNDNSSKPSNQTVVNNQDNKVVTNVLNNTEVATDGYRLYHYFDGQGYIPESHAVLMEVIRLMRQHKELQLEIISAADCIGNSVYNLALSQKRAEYIGSLIPGDLRTRIKLNWVGNTKPEEPCIESDQATPEAQQKNRYTLLRLYR
jgi:tetratricopeptide (TPR) repeat protein/outer membrane protein OmpA-like peptidoglycan-associated protein